LESYLKKFAKEMSVTYTKIKFYFDGDKINPKQTPEDLQMEEDDVIDAKF
jgi:hypothetical protein